MVEEVGTVYLDNIVRQKVDWQREATYYFETHQTEKGLALYEEHGRLHFAIKEADAQDALLDDWIAKVDSQGENALDGLVIAAFTNQAVDALNDKARSILVARGFLEQGKIISGRSIAVGERLLFTKNDYKSGYRNGHFATVNALQENAILVTLDNGKQLTLPPKALENCRYGYAATIHKLQGYTGDETFLMIDGRNWDRQKLLVGGSRHRYDLNLYASKENFAHVKELKEVLSRHGLNDALYDYPVSYATRRGYDTQNVAKVAAGRFSKLKRNVYDGLSYLFNFQKAVDDLSPQTGEEHPRIMLEQRRRDATIVATFADNRAEIAALLAVDASENQARIYRLRQENGSLAANILKDPAHFKLACERNRITTEHLTQAYDFSAKADRVNRLSSQYRNSESLHAEDAYLLSERLKDFYPHITMVFVDRYERQAFLNHVMHESHALRREKALEHFGMDRRADINQVMRYLQINDQISCSFEQNKPLLEREKEAFFSLLNDREKQAHDLLNSVHKEELLTFFHLDKSRLKTQASSYEDKLQVMAFDRLEKTPINQRGLLQKQHLAYRFRKDSKRFSKHILAVCKEGFKTVNLENWQYEKRLKEAKMSPEMKASFNRVKDYKAVASLAYTAWKKAFACQQKYSDAHKKSILRAQGFTYQRMRFAHAIVADLSSHLAALSTHRVDTKRLVQEARVATYLQRYQAEVKAPLKLHMAHYISMNLKEYRAGLTYLGLEQEVYEKASHYQYLKTLKKAPSVEHKQLIRLTYQYQKRAYEAALLYKSTMTYPKKHTQSVLEQRMVRQAFEKRNQIAASIDAVIKQHPHLQSEGTLERFNVKKIHQQAAAFHTTKNKKPSRALTHSKLTTHSPIYRNAIEREVGKALDYTAAEKQIKEDHGLAAVGLQDLRFDEKSNLLWVPFTHDFNKASTYTGIPLEKLTDPWLMSPNGFYVAQKPDITHRLYIVNNLLDAKALSVVAERDAMVVMASEDRFSLLREQLEKASIHPQAVMIVTDSHSEQSKRDNALKAKIFSDKGATLYLAKGRVQENVSNVCVHEAFSRSEKIRGIDSILHTLKLDPMKAKKATLTSRFKKRLRQKHFEEKARIAMTRPSSLNHAPYYMTLSKPEKEALLQYLKAHQHLKTHNHLKAAKERMHQSRAVMTTLRDKIKILSRHPQYEHLKSERTSQEIHTLLNQHEKLSLTDFKAVVTHLNQVLMDKETEKSINNYVQGLKEKKPLGELKAFFNQEQLQFIQEVVRFNPVSDQSLENFSGSKLPVLHLMLMVDRRLSSRAKGESLDSEQERSR